MNAEKLLRVADAIEKHEIVGLGFNQGDWACDFAPDLSGYDCGTTACIAGWTVSVFKGLSPAQLLKASAIGSHAAEILQLTIAEEEQLFRACPFEDTIEVSAEQAVRALRHAAKHGVVDWDAVRTGAP